MGENTRSCEISLYARFRARQLRRRSSEHGPKIPIGGARPDRQIGRRAAGELAGWVGSTDLFVAANDVYGFSTCGGWLRPGRFHALRRSQGTHCDALGNDIESDSGFLIAPYESGMCRGVVYRPGATWRHSGDDRIAANYAAEGEEATHCLRNHYIFGLASWLARLGGDGWDVAHTAGANFMPVGGTSVLGSRKSSAASVSRKRRNEKRRNRT